MDERDDDEKLLRSVALQNTRSILLLRQQMEQEILAAKEELLETQIRLQMAMEAGQMGAWEWIISSGKVSWSPTLEAIHGLPAGGFGGGVEDFHRDLHPEDRDKVLAEIRQSVEQRADYRVEYRIVKPDGTIAWIEARGKIYLDAGRNPDRMAGLCMDVTSRKQAGDALRDDREKLLEIERSARAHAEHMSEMKDAFLANLSHELRTPLSAIIGWAQVLRHGGRSEAELSKGLDTIERNARMQGQLIEDLLDMSLITSGKVRLDIQPVAPISFIDAAIESLRPAADAKNIRIEKTLDAMAGPVAADPNRMQQVIWNLLSNAIKFTPKGGKVQVLLERVNSHIEISVADTGIGIKRDFLPHVFERFRQADASNTRRYGGLGLGLSIVKQLVDLHGGTVRAQSPGDNCGTTFTVHLPATAVRRSANEVERLQPKTQPGVSPDFNSVDLSGIKILVVDDERDGRELLKQVLSGCDAKVFMAATAGEALLLVEKERPDVLISDIGMPDMDGIELLRQVRALGLEKGGRLPAIALTAFARSEDRTRALRAGFLVHISKPIEPAELVATVASIAGRTG